MSNRTLRNLLVLFLVLGAAGCLIGEANTSKHGALWVAIIGTLVLALLAWVFIDPGEDEVE